MKIKYKIGNLIEAEEVLIAHGCNAEGAMGAGVALAIKHAYPEAYRKYQEEVQHTYLGDIIYAPSKEKIILHCITQSSYGNIKLRYVNYEAVALCMEKIEKNKHYKAIAMPMIGAGLGGGNWNILSAIIEETLQTIQPVVYVLQQTDLPIREREDLS